MAENTLTKKRKLWTHDTRMFDERIFYLNNTATRFIIVGVDPETFKPSTKICDAATGEYLTISSMEKNLVFCDIVELLLQGVPPFDGNTDFIVSPVRAPENMVWKLTDKNTGDSIVLNQINLENIYRYNVFICHELRRRERMSSEYAAMIARVKDHLSESLRDNQQLSEIEKIYEIYASTHRAIGAAEEDLWYQVVSGIVTGSSYLKTLPLYENFYN